MLRAQLAAAALSATSIVAPATALGLTAPDGTYDVGAALEHASAQADCHPSTADLAAIQHKESPSAVVGPGGIATTPDGQPIRGDGGDSSGPFQFQAPTWRAYAADGDNPDSYLDAAEATARMLCANGYATDRMAAIARHNGSGPAATAYAADVDRMSKEAATMPATASGATDVHQDGSGCEPAAHRYSLGAVANRAWCNLVVSPLAALRARGTSPQWETVDHWIFGPDAKPSTPAPAAPPSDPAADGLQPDFAARLNAMMAAAPGAVTVTSGYRSTEEQQAIIANHGGECGVWVACVTNGVCGSMHCKGLAADLSFADDATASWWRDHAADYGLVQPMPYEPWHWEPAGART